MATNVLTHGPLGTVGTRVVAEAQRVHFKTAIAATMFFSVALFNPRDFPIENVPLIYPAFLLFWMVMGNRTMLQALRKARFIFLLLVAYQTYFTILRLTLGEQLP